MSNHALTQTQKVAAPTLTPTASGVLQRQYACSNHASGGECEECKKKHEGTLQRPAISPSPVQVPPIVHEVLRSPGQPLDANTRAFMEPRFGHDFSGVRVHVDTKAAESARAVNALAYTVGRDVVFGGGQHEPTTNEGRKLMAHELTHVVQQRQGLQTFRVGQPDDMYEREADSAAERVASHRQPSPAITASDQRLQRSVLGTIGDVLAFPFVALYRLLGGEYYQKETLQRYLADLKKRGDIENNYDSDNKARACVKREAELGPYDINTKVLLIREMLTGYTSGRDESAIITLLRGVSGAEREQIVNTIGRDFLRSKFSGRNRRIVEALTLTAADAGDALVDRLRRLDPSEIQDYAANVTDPAVRESVRRAAALANITAPVPTEAQITPAGEANLTINGVRVIVKPDTVNPSLGNIAYTHGDFETSIPGEITITPENANLPVAPFAPVDIQVTIWTEFPSEEAKQKSPAYGVGTRPQDKPTLQYHERAHGEAWFNFLRDNPPPAFTAASGMLPAQFNAAVRQWRDAFRDYKNCALNYTLKAGDCVGRLPTDEQLRGTGFTAAICHQE